MSTRTAFFVLGCAAMIASAGAVSIACNGGDSNGGSAGDSGASGDSTTGGGDGSGSSSGGPGDGGGVHEAAPPPIDCGAAPTLTPDDAGTVRCIADEGGLTCKAGEECCLGGTTASGQSQPTECSQLGAACLNGGGDGGGTPAFEIQCWEVSQCAAGGIPGAACCLKGAQAATCAFPYYYGGTAIVCEGPGYGLDGGDGGGDAGGTPPNDAGDAGGPTCAGSDVQICQTKADCPAAKSCVPGKWRDFMVGFCK